MVRYFYGISVTEFQIVADVFTKINRHNNRRRDGLYTVILL